MLELVWHRLWKPCAWRMRWILGVIVVVDELMEAKNNDVSGQVLRERNDGVEREKKRKRGE